MNTTPPYRMSLDLNVLNHVGINLYSNIPAVLSEVVANAWDADATRVEVSIEKDAKRIVIQDNGHGMRPTDINGKFLRVGYQRRQSDGGGLSETLKRPVMGRKGIGKLSLFSIARTIEIHTVRDNVKSGFRMQLEDIEDRIKHKDSPEYFPPAVENSSITITEGTRIVLTDLRKRLTQAEPALRRRLARRFSVIGAHSDFVVAINGTEISVADRDYFHKIQYLWTYGDNGSDAAALCNGQAEHEVRGNAFEGYSAAGWIGTVAESTSLKDEYDNLNKITVLVRGKLAQEDILEDFNEGGIYTKYLIGEIHADFLDSDDSPDIATSSRQKIIEDDPRYVALRRFVHGELKHIGSKWSDLRNQKGAAKALEIPVIKEWFDYLDKDQKKKARSLFGKINQLTVDSAEERVQLFKYGVLAFESLRYRANLDAIESLSAGNVVAFGEVLGNVDDIEATLYHQIVRERLRIIEALKDKVEEDALEKVIQEHLFDHLWLLDPSWERVTGTEYMEQRVETEFSAIDAKLSEDERKGRVDIKWRKISGEHVIIELKRAGRVCSSTELVAQVDKYRNALRKCLEELDTPDEPIEVVCVVGKPLSDWSTRHGRTESRDMCAAKKIRVVLYQELLESSYKAYNSYFKSRKDAGRVFKVIESLEDVANT